VDLPLRDRAVAEEGQRDAVFVLLVRGQRCPRRDRRPGSDNSVRTEHAGIDVEIRGPEADKGEYEPKEGAKYEATDSGAVYYGNGTSWVLADRTVGSLESDSFATGEYLKAGDSSTAIVAPSVASAFDGIQEAIDAGHRDIILAEEITEAGITIPKVDRQGSETDRFRLSGVGDGQYQTINDPGTEEYVIRAEPGDTRGVNSRVLIENLFFDRKSDNSGYAILGAKNIHDPNGPWNAAGNWMLRDIVSRAGPIALVGPRNILFNVDVANWSDRMFPIIGKTDNGTGEVLYDRYGGLFRGATFGMYGGAYMAKKASRSAAYLGSGAFTVTGGTTFTNARDHRDNFYTSNLCFTGASRGTVEGISGEGSTDYGIQFGLEDSGQGPGDASSSIYITGVSAFDSINIQSSVDDTYIQPFRETTIRKDAPAKITFHSGYEVTYEDGHTPYLPHEITHIDPYADKGTYRVGGRRNSPPTPMGLQIHTSSPDYPAEACFAVADGGNWDPVGNGNAALVAYDTDGRWKPIFEYSNNL